MFTADINADGKVYGEKNVYTQYPSERLGLRVYERTNQPSQSYTYDTETRIFKPMANS